MNHQRRPMRQHRVERDVHYHAHHFRQALQGLPPEKAIPLRNEAQTTTGPKEPPTEVRNRLKTLHCKATAHRPSLAFRTFSPHPGPPNPTLQKPEPEG